MGDAEAEKLCRAGERKCDICLSFIDPGMLDEEQLERLERINLNNNKSNDIVIE